MASPLSKYAFVNAKLRARISKILPEAIFESLASASSVDAALALLRDTPFAGLEQIYAETGDLKLAELELLKREIELYRQIRRHVHEDSRPLVDALLSAFEIDNLKNAIRLYFDRTIRNRAAESGSHYILYERILHSIPMDVVVNANHFDEIAGVCEGTPYASIIRKYSATVESEGSLFRMEIGFDHHYYGQLRSCIDRLDRRDRAVALRLIGVEIDLHNISWVIRFKEFYDLPLAVVMTTIIPGGFGLNPAVIDDLYRAQNVTSVLQGFIEGKYPGLSALLSARSADSTARLLLIRRILDEIRKQEVQHILSGYPFTVGILLAYFLLKKSELKKLRMLLNAKEVGRRLERIESLI